MKKTFTKKSELMNCEIEYGVIDLFCGAGGTTTGAENAGENIKVIACINHDQNAIKSHDENYPFTKHFTEDIRDFKIKKLLPIIAEFKRRYPGAKIVIWASLECTNHSNAKGGGPKDADSRTLGNDLEPYIELLKPDYLYIENVREFLKWGPVDEEGIVIKEKEGESYDKWVKTMNKVGGFKYEYKIFNAADFGAYTSRIRYFGQFVRHDDEFAWPEPTHSKKGGNNLFDQTFKWKAVKDVLELDNEGQSIFTRKKQLAEATLQRIYYGLEKFVANGEKTFIKRYNGGDPKEKSKSINKPIGSISTQGRHAIVNAKYIVNSYSGGGQVNGLNRPAPTVMTNPKSSLVDISFMSKYYGTGKNIQSLDQPCGTVTTKDRFQLVKTKFLYNPQYQSKGSSIENPCFTLIARMDKAPPYIITAEEGAPVKKEFEGEMMGKIIDFMIKHGIGDIKMRMLEIPELLRIQGFPEDYKLVGTKTEQKKYIGNAVECNQAKAIFEARIRFKHEISIAS